MGRTRVLVVEDDQIILDLITTRLDIAGYDTYFARDGFEGLKRLHELRPSALVLDLNMPRLDGFGLLRKMRQEGLNVPTMVLTARNQPDDVRQAITLGARGARAGRPSAAVGRPETASPGSRAPPK